MIDVTTLTAEAILAVPKDQPQLLFSSNEDEAKDQFRKLSHIWHPDRRPSDLTVQPHFSALYDLAIERIKDDSWVKPNTITIKTKDGYIEIVYRRHHKIDLGDMYISDNVVTFLIDREFTDLYRHGVSVIKGFKFANEKMKEEVARFLPVIQAEVETADRLVLVVKKTKDLVLLRDVIDHFKGEIDCKHVAWITSRLYNFACYLEYCGLSHPDISPDTVFISPEKHSMALLGGWWFVVKKGEKLKAAPARTIALLPSDLLKNPKADGRVVNELVRSVGRETLGDVMGSKLLMKSHIPAAMSMWLRGSGTEKSIDEYKTWVDKILKASFGERRYVELKLTADDLYGVRVVPT